jgi:hypothetical protein
MLMLPTLPKLVLLRLLLPMPRVLLVTPKLPLTLRLPLLKLKWQTLSLFSRGKHPLMLNPFLHLREWPTFQLASLRLWWMLLSLIRMTVFS